MNPDTIDPDVVPDVFNGEPAPAAPAVDVDEPLADETDACLDSDGKYVDAELDAVVAATPAAEIVIERLGVVVTCRWYDEWSVPTAEEMAHLLREVSTGDARFRQFATRLREEILTTIEVTDAQRRELRDASLRLDVMIRDGYRCRFCGKTVAFGSAKDDVPPADHGRFVHLLPEIASGAANIVLACGGCSALKGDRTPEEAGMPLLPCPTRPEMVARLAAGGTIAAPADEPSAPAPAAPSAQRGPVGFQLPENQPSAPEA